MKPDELVFRQDLERLVRQLGGAGDVAVRHERDLGQEHEHASDEIARVLVAGVGEQRCSFLPRGRDVGEAPRGQSCEVPAGERRLELRRALEP